MPFPDQIGGCEPVRAPTGGGGIETIRARAFELTQLSPEDYRGVAVPIFATLGPGVLTGQDTYRVPTTHQLSIKRIVGHIALIDYTLEVRDIGPADATKGISDQALTTAAVSFRNRVAAKAMNCTVDLKNSDREQKLIDNHPLSLATILALIGGDPVDWSEAPHIVPPGETLLLNVALIQQDTKMVGGNTQYGVMLIADLIRVARS